LTLTAAAGWIWSGVGLIPLIAALTVQSGFALALRSRVSSVIAASQAPGHELVILSRLLSLIENETAQSERLVDLQAALTADGAPPSKRISELRRLLDLLDARKNQFFAPIGAILLWGTQVAIALEAWRARSGPGLQGWIDAAAESEALCALAGYAYENPDHIYPELIDTHPCFEGSGLGHPLISPLECVPNDLSLGGERKVLMMSGSNMSGKSTMLRTVGCATVLAMAGAPIKASQLRLSPMQVAASIRISDSLQQGISHFLAEVQRLGQVVNLTKGDWPVLFLLDEVLHGTNSHDRRIGAGALVRELLERTAIGIVTTHDLALAELASEEPGRVENVHFQDQIVDGRMVFDYRLRTGVVTHSNALELMRSVGLDV
jgi:DNA mismatch repair ATPase MutS